jgi:hypothetical protein
MPFFSFHKLKAFPDGNKAKKAYAATKPYVIASIRLARILIFGIILYVWDALNNLRLKARNEPFIALAGLATVVYAVFAYNQWIAMRGQLDEMRADRRPWISVNPSIGNITWDKDGFHVAVRTNIENTGKSPAFGVLLLQELFPSMGTPEINGPWVRVRQISAEQRHRSKNSAIGFPVFPGKIEVSIGPETYSRDKIAALNAYIKTFRSSGNEKPSEPPIERLSFLPIDLIYVASYFFDVGEEVHETYCFASIDEIDETNPLGILLSPPVDVNLPASRLRLVTQPIGCNAD